MNGKLRQNILGMVFSSSFLFSGCGFYERQFPPDKEELKREILGLEEEISAHKKAIQVLEETIQEKKSSLYFMEKAPELENKGYNARHALSCGPATLSALFARYKIIKIPEEISKEILEINRYNSLRNFLSVFSRNAEAITFSEEMGAMCEKYNFICEEIYLPSLEKRIEYVSQWKKEINGFLLLRKKNSLSYHWNFYDGKIDYRQTFGKESTIIEGIYEVRKDWWKIFKQSLELIKERGFQKILEIEKIIGKGL